MSLMIDRLDFKRWHNGALDSLTQKSLEMEPTDMLGIHTPAFEVTNVADLCYRMDLFDKGGEHLIELHPEKFPNVAPPFRSYWMEWRCPEFLDKDKMIGRFGIWCVITDRTDDDHWVLICAMFVNERKPKVVGRFDLTISRQGLITDPGQLRVFPEAVDYVLARDRAEPIGDLEEDLITSGVLEAAASLSPEEARPLIVAERERLERLVADADERATELLQQLADHVGDALRIGVLPPLLMAHSLLGCKNVDTEDHHPDAKLNRAAIKRRGQPLVQFKTLAIRPMGGHHEPGQRVHLGNGQTALHLVRGHFKTFTPERPLFGTRIGTYWWSPNARGKAEHGTVVKDYKLIPQVKESAS